MVNVRDYYEGLIRTAARGDERSAASLRNIVRRMADDAPLADLIRIACFLRRFLAEYQAESN